MIKFTIAIEDERDGRFSAESIKIEHASAEELAACTDLTHEMLNRLERLAIRARKVASKGTPP